MPMSSAPIAPTTKSSIRCMLTRTSHSSSITSYAIGNTPTTACARTNRSPTSPHWNSSPVGKLIGERQSVTNLLDEYIDCRAVPRQARIDRFRRTRLVLTIRLSRIGKKKKPFYRVVVIERTRPRDGRVKEAVGTYDPLKKPAEIKLDAERIKYWIGLGAQPSD